MGSSGEAGSAAVNCSKIHGLDQGCDVTLFGLTATEFNGKRATIHHYDEETSRYIVQLNMERQLSVKADHLSVGLDAAVRSSLFSIERCMLSFQNAYEVRPEAEDFIGLSEEVAMLLTKGIKPEQCSTFAKKKVCPFMPATAFGLLRCGRSVGRLLVTQGNDPRAFFNFEIDLWQRLDQAKFFMEPYPFLYVAFTPSGPGSAFTGTLFAKLGFEEHIAVFEEDRLVTYLEQKSKHLNLIDVQGAGIFFFEVPRNFKRPIAAEMSLKAFLMNSKRISMQPTNKDASDTKMSSRCEWHFIRSRSTSNVLVDHFQRGGLDFTPLEALVCDIRLDLDDFAKASDPILPVRAMSHGRGAKRVRRKVLMCWSEDKPVKDYYHQYLHEVYSGDPGSDDSG